MQKIVNRKAFHEFELLDRFEAGINLYGAEVKAVRQGHADLNGSFVKIIGGEAYLVNAKIFPYEYARPEAYDERRTRKLLLHKKEIISIKSKMQGSNLTVVPISLYSKNNFIKAELAFAKGRKQYEKKEALKRKDIEREIEQELSMKSS